MFLFPCFLLFYLIKAFCICGLVSVINFGKSQPFLFHMVLLYFLVLLLLAFQSCICYIFCSCLAAFGCSGFFIFIFCILIQQVSVDLSSISLAVSSKTLLISVFEFQPFLLVLSYSSHRSASITHLFLHVVYFFL